MAAVKRAEQNRAAIERRAGMRPNLGRRAVRPHKYGFLEVVLRGSATPWTVPSDPRLAARRWRCTIALGALIVSPGATARGRAARSRRLRALAARRDLVGPRLGHGIPCRSTGSPL